MIELVPLCTAVVEVAPSLSAGTGCAGARSIGALTAVTIEGERMKATLASPAAADFMVMNGAVGVIDVRMAVRTDDGAVIYITYGGRLNLADRANGIFAHVAPVFETGDERYAWLNAVQAIGKGKLTIGEGGSTRIDYEFYQMR